MKRIVILISLMIVFKLSLGQKWENIYGYPGTNEDFADLIESYDNGFLITGSFEMQNATWLIKTDINGSILWEKYLVKDNANLGLAEISEDPEGNLLIGSAVSSGSMGLWPIITKLNPCGEKLWCRVFQPEGFDWGWFDDLLVLDNGDVIALAFFESELEYEHIFLYYIDSAGNLIWKQSYANRYDHPFIHSPHGDGIQKFGDNYLIHGECYYPDTSNPGPIYLRPLFVFIDEQFEEQWILPFGVIDTIIGEAFHSIELNDSIYMGVGVRRLSGDIRNSLLMFFNENGEEIDVIHIPNDAIVQGLSRNSINDICRIDDSLFIASTYFRFGNNPGKWGEMIIDTAGNIYSYEMRSDYTSGWTTLVKTFDNKFTIGCSWREGNLDRDIYMYKINENLEHDTLYPGTYTYDSLCPYQIQSGEIDLSDCMIITNVEETPSPKEYYTNLKTIPVKAYPNPSTTGMITLEYQNTQHHRNMELRCFNIFGEQVHKETIYPHQGKSIIPVSTWHKGIYLGLVYSDGRVAGRVKFVIR